MHARTHTSSHKCTYTHGRTDVHTITHTHARLLLCPGTLGSRDTAGSTLKRPGLGWLWHWLWLWLWPAQNSPPAAPATTLVSLYCTAPHTVGMDTRRMGREGKGREAGKEGGSRRDNGKRFPRLLSNVLVLPVYLSTILGYIRILRPSTTRRALFITLDGRHTFCFFGKEKGVGVCV